MASNENGYLNKQIIIYVAIVPLTLTVEQPKNIQCFF